ncbi:glutamate--cysteine ligase [Propionibacterium sp.]|uniref:glutamate--cysteine ligase n=1 Tax=Propionibacterium sp. TaxID=1977903 RepID=UPI0039EA62AE
MLVDFHVSQRATVGIEWELALVDSESLELTAAAAPLLEALHAGEDTPVRKEYLQNMIELVSSPHQRVADAVHDLVERLEEVRPLADAQHVNLMAAGCHPFSISAEQKTFDEPRYKEVVELNQWWSHQLAIHGMHIHIGVESKDHALPVVDALATFYPFFLALSASSPFWEGEDTGFASQRTMLYQQLPTNGLPWTLGDWSQFEALTEELYECGMITEPKEIRWDVRPSPKFGTVENRTADSVPTQAELGAIAALTQCVTEYIVRDLEGPHEYTFLEPWFVRENKWRAARYGVDAEVITKNRGQRLRPLREHLAEWLERLSSIADDLGCSEELAFAEQLATRGPSYLRQRRTAGAGTTSAESLRDVVRQLIAETGAPAPVWESADGAA